MKEQLYYNENEAAEMAGKISTASIRRAINAGDLRTVNGMTIDGKRIGRNVIKHADLVAWIEGKTK